MTRHEIAQSLSQRERDALMGAKTAPRILRGLFRQGLVMRVQRNRFLWFWLETGWQLTTLGEGVAAACMAMKVEADG